MKIYTRTGDDGETALFGGGRVSKGALRVEAYGSVDELNSVLGWTLQETLEPRWGDRLLILQHDLFAMGAVLATPPPKEGRTQPDIPDLPGGRIGEMEAWIDETWNELPPLRAFVLPGGSRGSAALHVARTVCRRAERSLVRLAESEPVDPLAIKYLNRLSDLLFAMARNENLLAGVPDREWKKE